MDKTPSLGRTGNQLLVRPLTTTFTPTGWRDADMDFEWSAGTLATIGTNGKVKPVSALADKVLGILYCDRIDAFYGTVYKTTISKDDSGVFYIKPNVKTGSLFVATTLAPTTALVAGTDYDANLVNGVITPKAGGAIIAATQIVVSYNFRDPNKSGFTNVDGSGKVTVIEGYGEIATQVYDVTQNYAIGDAVYNNAAGQITSVNGSGSTKLGYVTKAPSAEDGELHVKVTL